MEPWSWSHAHLTTEANLQTFISSNLSGWVVGAGAAGVDGMGGVVRSNKTKWDSGGFGDHRAASCIPLSSNTGILRFSYTSSFFMAAVSRIKSPLLTLTVTMLIQQECVYVLLVESLWSAGLTFTLVSKTDHVLFLLTHTLNHKTLLRVLKHWYCTGVYFECMSGLQKGKINLLKLKSTTFCNHYVIRIYKVECHETLTVAHSP